DACCVKYTYACIITDEEGNEIRTLDVTLTAKHNYQYFKDYNSKEDPFEGLRRQQNGHFLRCVSPECSKKTRLRSHIDAENDHRCDICDYKLKIEYMNLSITAPREGQKPNYNIGCDSTAYYAHGRANNGIYWFVSDNGTDNWKIMDSNTTFVAGKYYRFSVDLKARDGFEFEAYYQYNSNVKAYINGDTKVTWPNKTYNQDLRYYITVQYNFGMCNDSVIENIIINNVTEPVAGDKPAYTADVVGNGYHIRTDYTRYVDDRYSWFIPENERQYYIVNGIGWFDLTKSDWVYSNESFIPGHEYLVYAYLGTEDGYGFAYTPKYYENATTGSVNSYVAEVNIWEGNFDSQRRISCSFICQGKEISTVMVNGLATPQAGETPDYTAKTAYPEWYHLDPVYGGTGGIIWYDSNGYMMESTDKFVAGKTYRVEIKITPSILNGSNTCRFVTPVSAYVNGKEVVARGDWDGVFANQSVVYIQYSFKVPASSGGDVSLGDINGDGEVSAKDS
ncbi:MAG: hypothetical protein IKU19_08510, partial [Clostridia bacterium]|nr:hypothetical protein [Clostridia bacterium]